MSRYLINGGNPLRGEVSIRGAKNASFKQVIASLLSPSTTKLLNLPDISDIHLTESIAKSMGSQISLIGNHSIEITTPKITSTKVPSGTGDKSRSSFMFAAPLLARAGEAIIPLPGGDKLGARPLDRLFDCYRQMNINIEEFDDHLRFTTTGLKPVHYNFPKPSHTVTEVILMTCALTPGESVIGNSAIEPEIDDLICMLNSMGAQIKRDPADPKTIIINGVPSLHGTEHQVIADRNEAVTFACAALATKGHINILRVRPRIIETFLQTIEKMGAKVTRGHDEVDIIYNGGLTAIDIETQAEPGFMTDWQAVFSLVLTQAVGCSSVVERVFPYRFQHIKTLNDMGAKTKFFNPVVKNPKDYYEFNPESDRPEYFHGVKIYGPSKLKPCHLSVSDLRAGAMATLAGLTAEGLSTIEGTEFIERGYERLADRLRALGADIQYIKT